MPHYPVVSSSMDVLSSLSANKTREQLEEDDRCYRRYNDLISALPTDDQWPLLRQYQGFWLNIRLLPGVLASQQHFQARPSDFLLATYPKSGTTWLKALAFAVLSRSDHASTARDHPLRSTISHKLIPYLEGLYTWHQNPNLDIIPSPRLLSTHMPFSVLPGSLRDSGCRVVYICRDPKDVFVSIWHFLAGFERGGKASVTQLSIAETFEMFCAGKSPAGPMWDHVLEYWNEKRKRPCEVLFLKYEELKRDPIGCLKRLAEFIGKPFTVEEERGGVVEEIVRLCSFETMSNLECNKNGKREMISGKSDRTLLFRRGEVGDWANHLTPEMAEKMDKITEQKFSGSSFKF